MDWRAVKFWRVLEALVWSAPVSSILKSSVPAALVKERNLPVKEVVEEALIKVPVVPVALTWNKAERSREAVVVAPTTNDLNGDDVAERKSPATDNSRALPKLEPVSSVSQPKVPPAQVKTLLDWQVARPAPLNKAVKRLELEAVVEKKFVVVAPPEAKILPATERAWLGVLEPMPRKPLALIVKAGVVLVASPVTVVVAR